MEPLHQGDILKIEKIKHPVLVLNDKSGIIIIFYILQYLSTKYIHFQNLSCKSQYQFLLRE